MTTYEFIATAKKISNQLERVNAIMEFTHRAYEALEAARELYNFCQDNKTLEEYETALDQYLQCSELTDNIMTEIKAEDNKVN